MINFTQNISDADYKKAIKQHYFRYKYTYIGPVLGSVMIITVIILTIMTGFQDMPSAIIPIMAGAALLLRPYLYIQNVFRSVKSNKLSSHPVSMSFTDQQQLVANVAGNLTTINLKDLYAYYNSDMFLFLYLAKNHYIVIDKRELGETNADSVIGLLESLHIERR